MAHFLPTINACLNALSFIFLCLGLLAIKQGQKEKHIRNMVSALISSTVFLISYVTYHALKKGVVTKYQGHGILRGIYFFILGTHTPLAMVILPLAAMAVSYALKGKFESHKKITRVLYPIWLYVSLTGIIIYLMLYVVKY